MAENSENSSAVIAENKTHVQAISIIANWATKNSYPFAVFRLPNQDDFTITIGERLVKVDKDSLTDLGTGFLIASFKGDHYFINQLLSYNSGTKELSGKMSAINTDSLNLDLPSEEIWEPYIVENLSPETSKDEYIKAVEEAIDAIKQTALIKVVPSRTKRTQLEKDFNIAEVFNNLMNTYPGAFVSLVSAPEIGTWVGATPESLIELDENGIFHTMSLAGTQPYSNSTPLHKLPWTQKEIEEQAMVSRYIINRFKEIRLREFEELGPRTVSAGNMAHLCTTFTVDTIATDFPDLGWVMLNLLHPTSAVCGMPKNLAQELLNKIEKYDRKLFSGYLGPVNSQHGSHIYVNLRCMEYQGNEGVLYAGAGVTAFSIPEEEWQETELKCNTVLNIITG